MNTLPPQAYFQQLNAYLQWQMQKLQELESKVGQLQQEIDELKKQRTVNVEKIEYKFDQLKIEKLDGTLHIGISPDIGKSIDDFTVNGSDVQTTTVQTDERSLIRSQIDRFLDEDGRTSIQQLEQNHRIMLGEGYADFMIEDIKRQMDMRIDHYMQSVKDDPMSGKTKADIIVDKIKTDIKTAIEQHMGLKKNKGDGGT
ncbi:MAG: spore germination protein GerPC [Paenibacillus sp.]|jgi:spore germination protein PC|nr:spore germination protein GerPC [Paenibacillus sp.]